MDEKMVQRERQGDDAEHANRNLAEAATVVSMQSEITAVRFSPGRRSPGCWRCGQPGYLAINCRQGAGQAGNGEVPDGRGSTVR